MLVFFFFKCSKYIQGLQDQAQNMSPYESQEQNVISKVLEPSLAQVLLDDHAKDGSDTVC